ASPQRRHRPVLDLPGSRNLRYSPVTALTALDSRIGTPSLPLSFPRTLAYRCSMLLCFCFSNEFFFCPARVNCDTVSTGAGSRVSIIVLTPCESITVSSAGNEVELEINQ